MKTTSRRKFIQNTSLVSSGLLIAGHIAANKSYNYKKPDSVSCAPEAAAFQLTGTVTSVKSGNWSDVATWGGKLPASGDTPLVSSGHRIIYDMATTTVAGININSGGAIIFDSTKSTTLQTTGNVLLQGTLQMQPNAVTVIQILRFTGINENGFVGGGMDPLSSDVGLWVMGGGQLKLTGSAKTSWTRAVDTINAAATTISMQAGSGWAAGDEITIAPTDSPTSSGIFLFEDKVISSVSGSTITLNSATTRPHAKVNNQWTAEVLNLTRNVRIEGTASGKAHVFIRSSAPQTIKYVQFRYLGPRKDTNGDGVRDLVLGRYGLHFHHSMDGSRGSVVEGSVMRDTDNHAYVPHVSHGILFKANISYNTLETAFWWDEESSSHDIVYEGNIVANCKYLNRSLALDTGDPNTPNFSVAGFLIGMGDDNIANGNVVVGSNTGDPKSGAAYFWQANNEGVWTFTNNMAHNNGNGLLTWQNSTKNHVVENTVFYNNGVAIMHGAYANCYSYKGGAVYANVIGIEASSGDTNRVRLENIAFDGGGIVDYCVSVESSPIPAPYPIFIRGCSFKGFKKAAVLNIAASETKNIDLIQCTCVGTMAAFDATAIASEVIRIQPATGQTIKMTKAGTSNIAAFAPTVWGEGKGLKAEYFNSNNFANKAFERVDSVLAFSEWSTGIHYKITSNTHSIRWTGQVQAQFSENYTFQLQSGGACRLWVNGTLLIDKWQDNYPNVFQSSPVKMEVGQKYDIKLDYFNTDDKTGVGLFWSSPSLPVEYVPQSQLFASAVTNPNIPNQAPVANAGIDVVITLPVNSTTLNGTASSDADGTIVSYLWSRVSGPAQYNIATANAASSGLNNLVAGTYVFRVQVTDNKGSLATDDVIITVNTAATQPQTLNITASPNPTTSSFRITVTSTGSGAITVNILDNQGNVKETFRNLSTNATGIVGASYAKGTYFAVAEQGTQKKTIQLIKM